MIGSYCVVLKILFLRYSRPLSRASSRCCSLCTSICSLVSDTPVVEKMNVQQSNNEDDSQTRSKQPTTTFSDNEPSAPFRWSPSPWRTYKAPQPSFNSIRLSFLVKGTMLIAAYSKVSSKVLPVSISGRHGVICARRAQKFVKKRIIIIPEEEKILSGVLRTP